MSDRDEIKSKLDIVEVIREYIPIKAVGANFQALCPFHNEKTPSFVISPEKQIWHCFGCGRGGDIFSFIMEKEGQSFVEALRLLAQKAGVTLKYDNPENRSKRNRLLDIMELAGKYYAHVLKSPTGRQAKEYLIKRGLKEETIEDWQLGYSPDTWSSLYDFLLSRPRLGRKYNDEEIFATGLIVRKDGPAIEGRRFYDRFRDRIMFPISDVNHNLVAFTARINPEKEKTEKMGKYINSPQSEIYDKSRVLFALNKAKEAIRKTDLAIVVEGQMDAISCHNYGFKNVVASSGTALTNEQVALLKRFTKNLALAFDMDEAGQNAADRGIKESLAQGMNIKIITLPHGKDPDDCLRENPADFKTAIEAAQPILEYYYQKISADLDLEKIDNKIIIRDKMFAMINLVPNKVEQGYWLKTISEKLDFSEVDIREEFALFSTKATASNRSSDSKTRASASASEKSEVLPVLSREEMLSELFLALLIKFPELISYSLENFDPSKVYPTQNSQFYENLIIYYHKNLTLNYEEFKLYLEELDADFEKQLNKLVLLGEKEFYSFDSDKGRQELIKIMVELKRFALKKQIRKLEKALSETEKNQTDDSRQKVESLMLELKAASEELNKLI